MNDVKSRLISILMTILFVAGMIVAAAVLRKYAGMSPNASMLLGAPLGYFIVMFFLLLCGWRPKPPGPKQ